MIKYLYFGLHDVLIKGKLNIKPDTSYLSDFVTYLKDKKIKLFLITDQRIEDFEDIKKETNIDSYFDSKNIIYITEKYYDSLTDFDKELKKHSKEKDNQFVDKYFKVFYFNSVFNKKKEQTLYVGHDVWTDCFYLHKYANINSVLLNNTLSNNYAPCLLDKTKLNIVNPTVDSFKEQLLKKNYDYSYLEMYAKKLLFNEVLGKGFRINDIIEKVKE